MISEDNKKINEQLYSSVYRNLEQEFVNLSNLIHIDDKQLSIYSVKIAELIIRTVVEVESISKELYFLNGGTKANDNKLYFDIDCLRLLEEKWELSKKIVIVSSPNVYFDLDENKILTPLKKANQNSTKSADWLKAYQAIKHNRRENLERGTLKNLIRALGALYILNIYYRNEVFDLGKDKTGTNFDSRLGSELFSVNKFHVNEKGISTQYEIDSDYSEYVYLLKATNETRDEVLSVIKNINDKTEEKVNTNLIEVLRSKLVGTTVPNDTNIEISAKDIISKYRNDCSKEILINNSSEIKKSLDDLRYEGILNKQQF